MRRVAHILSSAMAGPPQAVFKAFSYELTTANQSGATVARIPRFRINFDSARNRYMAIGQGYTSGYPTNWAMLDINNNLIWSRYVTGGQSTIDRPFSVTGVFPDSTATYYYVVGVSPLANAQGFNKVIVTKFNASSHAVVWNMRLDSILIQSGGAGLRGPYAAYDSSDDSLYIASMQQTTGAATAYLSLTKINGADGSVVRSKTSGNGVSSNQGNNTPWTPIAIYGNYIYLVTYSGYNVCVAKFNKSDFSKVWCKIASGQTMVNGTNNTVAFDVDSAGAVYVAATLSTTQTVVYKFPADGASANYVTFTTPSYGGMIPAQCYLLPHSIAVDNNSNVYITYGYHVPGATTATTMAIIGCFSFTGGVWKWIRAIDVVREDTGASIGVTDGWALSKNVDRIYFSGVCDVTAAGISNVDNNGQWQTLNFSIDLLGRRLTDGYTIGTFAANRRAVKVYNIAPTTMTKTTYTAGNGTLYGTMIDTGAVSTGITWTVTAATTDFVNKYN